MLRAVAAAMIVVLHGYEYVKLTTGVGLPLETLQFPMGAGVDLFFVISGFIIVYSSEKLFAAEGRGIFIRRRLIRIVPLYWLALLARLGVLAIAARAGEKAFPGAAAILTSFLFIPYDSLGIGDRTPFPILDVGWSLNYEMFFYAVFCLVIGFSRNRAALLLGLILLLGVVANAVWPFAATAPAFWLQPIALEFAAGGLLALMVRQGVRLPIWLRILLAVAGIALWATIKVAWFGSVEELGLYSWSRLLIWGVGAMLIMAAATLGPLKARRWPTKAMSALGDSSYALYLSHPFTVLVLVRLAAHLVPDWRGAAWLLVVAVVAISVICGHILHVVVERPLTGWLSQRFGRKAGGPVPVDGPSSAI